MSKLTADEVINKHVRLYAEYFGSAITAENKKEFVRAHFDSLTIGKHDTFDKAVKRLDNWLRYVRKDLLKAIVKPSSAQKVHGYEPDPTFEEVIRKRKIQLTVDIDQGWLDERKNLLNKQAKVRKELTSKQLHEKSTSDALNAIRIDIGVLNEKHEEYQRRIDDYDQKIIDHVNAGLKEEIQKKTA